jgi:hypothetical protein
MGLGVNIIIEIMLNLNDNDLNILCQTNKEFSKICNQPRVWELKIQNLDINEDEKNKFDKYIKDYRNNFSMKQIYIFYTDAQRLIKNLNLSNETVSSLLLKNSLDLSDIIKFGCVNSSTRSSTVSTLLNLCDDR